MYCSFTQTIKPNTTERRMNIPSTPTPWTKQVLAETTYMHLYDTIAARPIVAWFSSRKKAVHHLVKSTSRVGDDHWMVVGHNYTEKPELELMVTLGSTTLHRALRYLTPKNGWTLCEFPRGRDYHEAVLAYLDGPDAPQEDIPPPAED